MTTVRHCARPTRKGQRPTRARSPSPGRGSVRQRKRDNHSLATEHRTAVTRKARLPPLTRKTSLVNDVIPARPRPASPLRLGLTTSPNVHSSTDAQRAPAQEQLTSACSPVRRTLTTEFRSKPAINIGSSTSGQATSKGSHWPAIKSPPSCTVPLFIRATGKTCGWKTWARL